MRKLSFEGWVVVIYIICVAVALSTAFFPPLRWSITKLDDSSTVRDIAVERDANGEVRLATSEGWVDSRWFTYIVISDGGVPTAEEIETIAALGAAVDELGEDCRHAIRVDRVSGVEAEVWPVSLYPNAQGDLTAQWYGAPCMQTFLNGAGGHGLGWNLDKPWLFRRNPHGSVAAGGHEFEFRVAERLAAEPKVPDAGHPLASSRELEEAQKARERADIVQPPHNPISGTSGE